MIFTITAGHGGTDPGAVADGYTERDLMTTLRDLVAAKLRAAGHDVRTDGAIGQNLPLANALQLIPGSALALELHTNAAANAAAQGVEVISLPQHKRRAQRLAAAIAGVLGAPLRGEKGWIDQSQSARGRLAYVNAGGLIAEVFFISNPAERGRYLARYWLVASAIAAALTEPLEIHS